MPFRHLPTSPRQQHCMKITANFGPVALRQTICINECPEDIGLCCRVHAMYPVYVRPGMVSGRHLVNSNADIKTFSTDNINEVSFRHGAIRIHFRIHVGLVGLHVYGYAAPCLSGICGWCHRKTGIWFRGGSLAFANGGCWQISERYLTIPGNDMHQRMSGGHWAA